MTSFVRAQARALAAAFTFMTRVPLGALASHDPADLPASAVYFPLVGLFVGLVGAAVFGVASRVWPASIAVVMLMCATVLLTGAFHEDALADAFDGFGGGWSREQVLAIMKDSRVGSYALVGVTLTLALKFTALYALASPDARIGVVRALVAAHVLSRWSSLVLIRRYPYARPAADGERPSAGRPFIAGVTDTRLVVATLLMLIIVNLAIGWTAVAPLIVSLLVTASAGWYFDRRIGGITGDALGAANQIVEVCVYLTLAARLA
ncbi:MAG TPA: adenosylcobinamide-GDP ribazoletransferase [Gemmatimonadaceae bacterium]